MNWISNKIKVTIFKQSFYGVNFSPILDCKSRLTPLSLTEMRKRLSLNLPFYVKWTNTSYKIGTIQSAKTFGCFDYVEHNSRRRCVMKPSLTHRDHFISNPRLRARSLTFPSPWLPWEQLQSVSSCRAKSLPWKKSNFFFFRRIK